MFSFAFSPKDLLQWYLCKRSGLPKETVKMLDTYVVIFSLMTLFTVIFKVYH